MLGAAFDAYGGPEVLRWRELDDPVCGPDDVLVEVHACGVNHSDLDSRAGTSRWPFPMPHVLGAEFAGAIAEVGSAVRGWAAGDPVTAQQQYACGVCRECARWRPDLCPNFVVYGTDAWGGYAELVRVPARALLPLGSLDQAPLVAAAQTTVSTAWHMVTALADVRAGETVLVPSASGGVASALVQCARLAGARVIATVGDPRKGPAVVDLGADAVIPYRDASLPEAVAELTGGTGVDAVLDTVGGPLFADHLACLRPDGRLATCGAHAGEVVDLDIIELFRRGRRILGFRVATPDEIATSLRLVTDGTIRVPIARSFPQSDAAAAHEYLDRREHVGKTLLVRT